MPHITSGGLDRAVTICANKGYDALLPYLLHPSGYSTLVPSQGTICQALVATTTAAKDDLDVDWHAQLIRVLTQLRDVATAPSVDSALQSAAQHGHYHAAEALLPSSTNPGRTRALAVARSQAATNPACTYVVDLIQPTVRRYSTIAPPPPSFGMASPTSLAAHGAVIVAGTLGSPRSVEAKEDAPRKYNSRPRGRSRRHSATASQGLSLASRRVLASALG